MLNLKSKLSLIIGSIMAIALGFLKARNSDLKREAVEQELEDEKNAREQANKATEALIKGTIDEQNTSNPRNYKFGE